MSDAGATSLVATSDGATIAVSRAGQGPPWMLLHGFSTGPSDWQACAELLVDAGQSVILPSLRGHGASRAGNDGYGIDRLALDVVEVADGLGLAEFCLAGHSLGGTVAIRAAVQLDGPQAAGTRRHDGARSTRLPTRGCAVVRVTLGRTPRRGPDRGTCLHAGVVCAGHGPRGSRGSAKPVGFVPSGDSDDHGASARRRRPQLDSRSNLDAHDDPLRYGRSGNPAERVATPCVSDPAQLRLVARRRRPHAARRAARRGRATPHARSAITCRSAALAVTSGRCWLVS